MTAKKLSDEPKNSKMFYQKRWFWVVIIILAIIGIASPKDTPEQATNNSTAAPSSTESTASPAPQPKVEEPKVPAEYKSALVKARTYADTMDMSKQGVYDQLTSEYGEKFPAEAAQYAIDNLKADWNGNALSKARTYQDTMNMSTAAIRDQLVSPYGEKFTTAEADYAIQHLND